MTRILNPRAVYPRARAYAQIRRLRYVETRERVTQGGIRFGLHREIVPYEGDRGWMEFRPSIAMLMVNVGGQYFETYIRPEFQVR